MKRKTLLSITSLMLGASVLTACTSTSQKVSFSPYWYKTYNVAPETTLEQLVYDVSFQAGDGLSNDYTVDYNGTYTTTLTTKTDENGNALYRYETSLVMDVSYTTNSGTETRQDTLTSYVEFAQTTSLTPTVSHKEFVCHSPINGSISSVDSLKQDYSVHTTYNSACDGGTSVLTNRSKTEDNETTQTFEIETKKYTYLDNEQLLFALRGVNPSTYSAPSFLVYAPFTNDVQGITTSFGTKVEGTEFSFKKDDETEKTKRAVNYYPVTVAIDSSSPGASQTIWIAETVSATANDYRNVILRMECPVSYNLGTLVYELVSADFAD